MGMIKVKLFIFRDFLVHMDTQLGSLSTDDIRYY